MPYEDDYKMWLEEMLIGSNPDWICDEMCDVELTHEWCHKHCGGDSDYVTPKCLHLYYHHIARADRKTEPTISKMEQVDEPQTERSCTNCKHNGVLSVPKCDECHNMDKHEFIKPQTERSE